MYKSTDAGKTWTHLGLRDAQQITAIVVDPKNAERVYVAVQGHPYGPNAERGVFRSTNGGRRSGKGFFKNEESRGSAFVVYPPNAQGLFTGRLAARGRASGVR